MQVRKKRLGEKERRLDYGLEMGRVLVRIFNSRSGSGNQLSFNLKCCDDNT